MYGLKEVLDLLAKASSANLYGHVLREDGHALRIALDVEVEGRWKEIPVRMLKTECRKSCKSWIKERGSSFTMLIDYELI